MKIEELNLTRLRNEEHYQFHLEFDKLVEKSKDEDILIKSDEYLSFQSLLSEEGIALDLVHKRIVSKEIAEADNERDIILHGINEIIIMGLNHFNPRKREAANRLRSVFNKYDNLAPLPFDEETVGINDMILDLNTNYHHEITSLGLAEWIKELHIRNYYFDTLKHKYPEQICTVSQFRMKEVRMAIDGAYNTIVHRINTMIVINGEDGFSDFVTKLNMLIEVNRELIAKHHAWDIKKDIKDTIV